MLRFLVKTCFWLSLVILLVPVDPKEGAVDAGAAIEALQRIVSDASGFCGRNPDTCETAARLGDTFRIKAMTAVRRVYEFARNRLDKEAAANGTLSPEDRRPDWRKPALPPG